MASSRHILYLSGLLHLGLTLQCGGQRIFTDVTVEVKSLEELYPGEFEGERVELLRNEEKRNFGAAEHILGLYGSLLSLEAWDFNEKEKAAQLWQSLVEEKRSQKLRNFSFERDKELRFDYETEEGYRGLIFTNTGFLFSLEAKSDILLRKFIGQSKIARLE
ncbi:MAG: hypothetical protein RML34_08865 [Leptospiraceae bacterium]|nr:hypothetical protein [Leptospiraceae bacterium]